MDSWDVVFLCVILAGLWSFSCYHFGSIFYNNNGHRRLPPGPLGLPIFGHLHMLGDLPHRSLHKLAQKFGPIMYIRLGLVSTIVVSSPEAAELFLKTHDLVFANRPKQQAGEYLSYGHRNVAFGQYGHQWRKTRKICMLGLLSGSKIESMKTTRKEHVTGVVKWLVGAAKARTIVDVSAKVGSVVEAMTFQMIFGSNKYDTIELRSIVREATTLSGIFNLADYLPYIGALDLQGLGSRMKACSKIMDGFLESILSEHEQDARTRFDPHHRNFIDEMVSLMEPCSAHKEQLDRDTIKALIIDMIVGGMESSATAIEWTLTELVRHPRVMKQVQTELEKVVGMNRMVEESDLEKLEYLDLVVKESFRLHPVGPFLVPRESMEDIVINGYFIPKKSRLIVNTWAIGHDPRVWSANVDEFYPERFIDKNVDFLGHDLRFLPFGSGRRGCPGVQLGMTVVRLLLAQLVHCFNWELPNSMSSNEIDMDEKFGLTAPRANHLIAIPSFRLHVGET